MGTKEAIDKRKDIVIIGFGITGLLAAYEAVTKESDDIKKIIIIDNPNGGNFLAGINIKWFYSYSSKKLFDDLNIKYSMKYHVGAVYDRDKIRIFPQYVIKNPSILAEYNFKTRGIDAVDNNIMNTPYRNELENRVYFDIESHGVTNEILFRMRHVAKKKNISVEFVFEYVTAVDVFQRNVICKKDVDMDVSDDLHDGYDIFHFDYIISSIPLLGLINMTNFPDSSPLKLYSKNSKLNEPNYYCKTIYNYPINNDIWWDYLYISSVDNPIRRINVILDERTESVSYVCELINNDKIDSNTIEQIFYDIIGKNVKFDKIKEISGFVHDNQDISKEMQGYNIACFGRYATFDSRAMINTTYEKIKYFFSYSNFFSHSSSML